MNNAIRNLVPFMPDDTNPADMDLDDQSNLPPEGPPEGPRETKSSSDNPIRPTSPPTAPVAPNLRSSPITISTRWPAALFTAKPPPALILNHKPPKAVKIAKPPQAGDGALTNMFKNAMSRWRGKGEKEREDDAGAGSGPAQDDVGGSEQLGNSIIAEAQKMVAALPSAETAFGTDGEGHNAAEVVYVSATKTLGAGVEETNSGMGSVHMGRSSSHSSFTNQYENHTLENSGDLTGNNDISVPTPGVPSPKESRPSSSSKTLDIQIPPRISFPFQGESEDLESPILSPSQSLSDNEEPQETSTPPSPHGSSHEDPVSVLPQASAVPSRVLNPVYAERRNLPRLPRKLDTAEDFEAALDYYIEKQNLGHFYGENDPYVADLARQAVHLVNEGGDNISAETTQLYSDMTKIALYNTVVLVDDSGSMNSDEVRIPAVKDALKRITTIGTTFETEGIQVRFLNYPEKIGSVNPESGVPIANVNVPVKTVKQVEDIFQTLAFSGGTDIGGVLAKKIINPLLLAPARAGSLKRPILCSIITDGEPDSPEEVRRVIVRALKGLENAGYPASAIGFHITQVGNSKEAERFLDHLALDDRVGNRIYCTSGRLDEIAEKFSKGDLVGAYTHWWVEELITAIDPVAQSAGLHVANE